LVASIGRKPVLESRILAEYAMLIGSQLRYQIGMIPDRGLFFYSNRERDRKAFYSISMDSTGEADF